MQRGAHLVEDVPDEGTLRFGFFLHDAIAGQKNFFLQPAICVIADEAPMR